MDELSCNVLAGSTAACDGKKRFYVVERLRSAIHDFADLAITDCAADTNVHGGSKDQLV
jgi:hypothetical protein